MVHLQVWILMTSSTERPGQILKGVGQGFVPFEVLEEAYNNQTGCNSSEPQPLFNKQYLQYPRCGGREKGDPYPFYFISTNVISASFLLCFIFITVFFMLVSFESIIHHIFVITNYQPSKKKKLKLMKLYSKDIK